MPENNSKGVNQLSDHGPSQAFLQNLFLGENLRQRQKEIEVANELDQQQIIQNDLAIARNKQIIDEAMREAFNADQAFRQGIALGTTPSEFEGSSGSIYDVANMIAPNGQTPQGAQPTKEIQYGKRKAKNYKGETIEVGPEEQQSAQKAFEVGTELKTRESLASAAGSLASNQQAHNNRLRQIEFQDYIDRKYQEEVVFPREIEKQKALFNHELRVERIRADSRRSIANTGTSGMAEEFYEATVNGTLPFTQVPKEVKDQVLALHRANGTVLADPKKVAGLQDLVTGSLDLISSMERAAMTFQEEGNINNFLKTGGFMMETGLPFTDVRAEVGKMKEQAIILARAATRDRVTDRDAFAFETGSMPAPTDSPEIRQRKINDAYVSIGRGLKSSGLPDSQIIQTIGADAIPFLEAVNKADTTVAQKNKEIQEKKALFLEAVRQKLMQDPSLLANKNLTIEQALKRASDAYDAREGIK